MPSAPVEPPIPTTHAELAEYLRRQWEVWLPWIQAGAPETPEDRPRLTLLQGGAR